MLSNFVIVHSILVLSLQSLHYQNSFSLGPKVKAIKLNVWLQSLII